MTNHTTHMKTKGYLLLALACLSSAALAAPETFDFHLDGPHHRRGGGLLGLRLRAQGPGGPRRHHGQNCCGKLIDARGQSDAATAYA